MPFRVIRDAFTLSTIKNACLRLDVCWQSLIYLLGSVTPLSELVEYRFLVLFCFLLIVALLE